ncbi:putative aminoacyl tRNA synthase complex-interacting multifunctional protein 1 [Iris pallida]|uniref:Aminoacyl tRNA synthase complex-interacting multifunctional protein 1 n=1 Tax=Iris pallida TaxID=29817 RepID=A0AAX6GTM7_IRIPA|nr:putative aminoacyl tRNA synthase complex-interacting multifunctional protein 1 [Iris pallida]
MAAMARSASSLLIASSIANLSSTTRPWSSSRALLPIISSSKIEKKNHPLLLSSSSSFSFRARTSMATEAGGETSPSAPPPPPPLVADAEEKVDPLMEAANALDMRVGRVLKAWRHPEADSLYVEEVDVGEAEPRTICSGLVNYIPLEHLQDRKVIVLANLKPRNMRGIKSNGMLMAASDASHEVVELLLPPEGSAPGERIWFGEEEEKDKQADAASPNQVQKKKIWEFVQPHLKTTDACVAVLGAHPMRTSAGVVTCTSLKNANIS